MNFFMKFFKSEGLANWEAEEQWALGNKHVSELSDANILAGAKAKGSYDFWNACLNELGGRRIELEKKRMNEVKDRADLVAIQQKLSELAIKSVTNSNKGKIMPPVHTPKERAKNPKGIKKITPKKKSTRRKK